jgi:hypothetical protein
MPPTPSPPAPAMPPPPGAPVDADGARSGQPAGADMPSPVASRLALPRWLDVRLVIGMLLVLVSVVVGARIIAAADDTVPVLAATADLVPGQPLTAELVETRNVLIDQGLDRYFTGAVGDGHVVVRPVSRGELLPRTAVSPVTEIEAVRYVTLPVQPGEVPAGLSAGSLVDVWVPAADGDGPAQLLLEGVTVTASSAEVGGLGSTSGQVQVTLAVVADDLDAVTAELVAAARAGRIYLTALPAVP